MIIKRAPTGGFGEIVMITTTFDTIIPNGYYSCAVYIIWFTVRKKDKIKKKKNLKEIKRDDEK